MEREVPRILARPDEVDDIDFVHKPGYGRFWPRNKQ
jgi:hypothetical protein